MAIEQIYPYIAVAYGTFGILFGVMLWWKTQRRIDRTKSAIEVQVANAVVDITGRVDTKLGAIKVPDTEALGARISAQIQEVSTSLDQKIDELDLPELDTAGLEVRLCQKLADHIEMAIKNLEAQRVRAIQSELEKLPDFESMAEAAKKEMMGQLDVRSQLAARILERDYSKKFEREHPDKVMVYDMGKWLFANIIGGNGAEGVPGFGAQSEPVVVYRPGRT